MRIRTLKHLIYAGLALVAAGYLYGWWRVASLNFLPFGGVTPEPEWGFTQPERLKFPEENAWARPGMEQIASEIGNFTLAGTFQTYDFPAESRATEAVQALALVDDARNGRQVMVREQDRLGPFTVAEIGQNQIVLQHEDQKWTLSLPGAVAQRRTPASRTRVEQVPKGFDDLPALETNRFGKRVAENQWVIDRQALLDYAGEIVGNPYRATQLYRSFDQVVGEDEEGEGFQISMKGEKNFFSEMGLADDDVIRKVNSMQLKNQTRAEYLIQEFMKARMSAVVLDVDRGGEVHKQIYMIR